MKILNITKGTAIADEAHVADTFLSRLIGLLNRKELPKGHALIINNCKSIHMFFMRFSIDAVFVDKENCVVGLLEGIKPFCVSPVFFKSRLVIELPAGTIEESKIEVDDQLRFQD